MPPFQSYLFSLLLLALSPFSAAFAEEEIDPYKDVKIETIHVGSNIYIYMLMGQGGNIGLSVGDDGIFMIDDQFVTILKWFGRVRKML